jgi:hypothetical protein
MTGGARVAAAEGGGEAERVRCGPLLGQNANGLRGRLKGKRGC